MSFASRIAEEINTSVAAGELKPERARAMKRHIQRQARWDFRRGRALRRMRQRLARLRSQTQSKEAPSARPPRDV